MANTRISDLTASASNLASTDLAPVVQTVGVGPVKMTGLQLAGGLLGSTTFNGSTVTTSSPVLNLSQTWNAGAVAFTGLKFNVTNTASSSSSNLIDLQVNTNSAFAVQNIGGGAPTIGLNVANGSGFYGTLLSSGSTKVAYFGATATAGYTFALSGGYYLGFYSSGSFDVSSSPDLILTRAAAATLRLGAADAAAPVAQTLLIQSGSGTDINGVAFNIGGSKSTGTGAAGLVNIQTSSRGAASGTSQNVLATVASFGPNTLSGSQAISLLDMAQTWNTTGAPIAISLNVTNTASGANAGLMNLQIGGNSKFFIGKSNLSFANSLGGNAVQILGDQANGYPDWGYNGVSVFAVGGNAGIRQIALASSAVFGWTNATSNLSGSIDTSLARDAANTLALRNGTNAQNFRVYNSYTDASNGEWLETLWSGNNMFIRTQANGTGTQRSINIQAGAGILGLTSSAYVEIGFTGKTWQFDSNGTFKAGVDNTYDIGASGTTNRVRTFYSGGGYSAAAPTIKTGNYSQGIHDYSLIFNGSGSITLTLLAAATYPGKILYVKTIAAQTVVSASSNVKPIDTDTAGTAILAATAGKWAMLQSDGTDWVIMAQG